MAGRFSGIYQFSSTCKVNRVYVGSSVDVFKRKSEHLRELRQNKHSNGKLQNHYNKYGESDLVFSVIIGCDKVELIGKEQFFIDSLNPWFNICRIANSQLGVRRSIETRKKYSDAKKGIPSHKKWKPSGVIPWNKGLRGYLDYTEEMLNKMRDAKLGKKQSKETCDKKSVSLKGNQNALGNEPWNKGGHLSNDDKKNKSIALKKFWKNKKNGDNSLSKDKS